MKTEHIHFIREVLILDKRGRRVSTIEVSYSQPFAINPTFRQVARNDQKEARAIYKKLGGGRLKDWWVGLTIIIPN